PWPDSDAVELRLDQTSQIRGAGKRKNLEFQTRRTGIDDQQRVHGDHAGMAAARSLAWAYSTASAHDASRERTESARDVRITGTRAPSTMPAESALASRLRFLASILPASRPGTTRICACPATFELIPLMRAALGSMALSKASGPSRSAPVICPRSAIL